MLTIDKVVHIAFGVSMNHFLHSVDIPASTFHTKSVEDYRHAIDTSFVPLKATLHDTTGFYATLTSAGADGVAFTEVCSTPQIVERTPELIEKGGAGFYKVSILLEGSSFLIQDGREVVMKPGDITFYDTTRPYSLEFGDQFRNLIMMFPKDRIGFSATLTDSLTAVSLNETHPLAAAVGTFVAQASPQLPGLSTASRTKLAHTCLDLLGTMFAAVLDSELAARGSHQELLHRIFAYIDAHLSDTELSPRTISAAHFISTRHLHALFQEIGTTVSSHIKARRLERCRIDLLDPAHSHRAIASIAAHWGFVDAAHFSRVFRAAYGVSPSALRVADSPISV